MTKDIAKPVVKAAYEGIENLANKARPIFGNYTSYLEGKNGTKRINSLIDNFVNNINKNHSNNLLIKPNEEIPFDIKKNAVNNYSDFINSQAYRDRLQRAGFDNSYQEEMQKTIDDMNDTYGFFPSHIDLIDNDPKIYAQTNIIKKSPNYGISAKHGQSIEQLQDNINHEVPHWATKILEPLNENLPYNMLQIARGKLGKPLKEIGINPNKVIKLMLYDKKLAPNISYNDFRMAMAKNEAPPEVFSNKEKLNEFLNNKEKEYSKYYKYLTMEQERRARAFAELQKVKETYGNYSDAAIDKYVDSYYNGNNIAFDAPMQLRQLNEILTKDNLKKYLKNFLSIATPVGLSLPTISNNK